MRNNNNKDEFEINQINDLIEILKKFKIEKNEIEKITKNKFIFKKFSNTYLVDKGFSGKLVSIPEKLLTIQLKKKQIPTTYLLNKIKGKTKNNFQIKSREKALKFLYGKKLKIKTNNIGNGYHIITWENEIIGVGKIKKDEIKNIFNISEYLKEN